MHYRYMLHRTCSDEDVMRMNQENGTHSYGQTQHITREERAPLNEDLEQEESLVASPEDEEDVAQDLSMATDDVANNDTIES